MTAETALHRASLQPHQDATRREVASWFGGGGAAVPPCAAAAAHPPEANQDTTRRASDLTAPQGLITLAKWTQAVHNLASGLRAGFILARQTCALGCL